MKYLAACFTVLQSLAIAVLISSCTGNVPEDATESPVAEADSSLAAIAVISLDPSGWDDLRGFIRDLPTPTVVKIFYGDGFALEGTNKTAMKLLDSLSSTNSLTKADVPATLPYFSTALIAAIGASLETSCKHTRTVVLGTFPPLLLKSRSEFERIGPIITRTELESLSKLPDHKFIIIGPSEESILREMLLRALSESNSKVTSLSYQSGVN